MSEKISPHPPKMSGMLAEAGLFGRSTCHDVSTSPLPGRAAGAGAAGTGPRMIRQAAHGNPTPPGTRTNYATKQPNHFALGNTGFEALGFPRFQYRESSMVSIQQFLPSPTWRSTTSTFARVLDRLPVQGNQQCCFMIFRTVLLQIAEYTLHPIQFPHLIQT